jgi:hypothetical protein
MPTLATEMVVLSSMAETADARVPGKLRLAADAMGWRVDHGSWGSITVGKRFGGLQISMGFLPSLTTAHVTSLSDVAVSAGVGKGALVFKPREASVTVVSDVDVSFSSLSADFAVPAHWGWSTADLCIANVVALATRSML